MSEEYYDDNFGHWHDTDDEEVKQFYKRCQERSVWKICKGCGRKVKLLPDYDKCDSCVREDEGT